MPVLILVCMRLADMLHRHPRQDDSRVCARCKNPIGIYPSGQAMIASHSGIEIICTACAVASADPSDVNIPAARDPHEMAREMRESYQVKRH